MQKKIEIIYQSFSSIKELDAADRLLVERAIEASKAAYAPYSNFFVGSAVRLQNGEILCGNNQENAAYPSGLCAERVAVFSASAQNPNTKIEAIAVTASPCGACRQVLKEYEDRYGNIRLLLYIREDNILVFSSIADLLPFSFGSKNLNV